MKVHHSISITLLVSVATVIFITESILTPRSLAMGLTGRQAAVHTSVSTITMSSYKFVYQRPKAKKIGEYGGSGKALLDSLAEALKTNPSAQGYIIAYGGRRGPANEAQTRADFAKNYLINRHDIDAGRLVTVDGGFKETASTEPWFVPSGAIPPTASPTVDPSQVQSNRPTKSAPRRGRRRHD